ncbi:cytochrome c oxidase subunit 1 [Tessaracoccus bendigoensis DSM 12906]|uniref:Cytochrome c oxidase subunit 1 n=1 Tax=Tessaracoccus bendigoensis DSM 12906 TaxID=1123357 RepID=A0A1M6AV26_9ACTN|nr:cytochrome c oxidase subunit I [Tessaracoccus bendigoensis]SHI40310.1 cytochrome c oxidase subunit 1 [Tessaracoccus bendigoensis DSM 12906]
MSSASVAARTRLVEETGTRTHVSFGQKAMKYLTTTDHKVIGNMYFVTAFVFFGLGGLLALGIRAELANPGMDFMNFETFNQFFTMHGTIMLLMFATPMFSGFANAILPLQLGAPDVAFPRLNSFAYWLYLFGSIMACAGFASPGGAASFGWFAYAPLSNSIHSPGVGHDLWIMGLYLLGLSSILGAVNFVTTIITMRAPGLTMFRMPIFSWNILVTSMMILICFPVLAAGLLVLAADRVLGSNVLDPASGGAILWQHLFWFFGHPEVYVIALPFFGIITEVLSAFSRKPVFGYYGLVFATLAIGALSISVWAHHMFVTGAVNLPFFSFMTFMIAVPTGVKFFNWIGTLWRGSLTLNTSMTFAIGFLVTFLFGGLTGIILASPALNFPVSDTYFVVAHFHYVLFGTVVFAMFAGFYYWWPKFTGKMLNETWGKIHFWTLFIGFHTTFLVQHWLGVEGMQRRIADYGAWTGFTFLNQVSTFGAFLLGVSMLPFLWNVWITRKSPSVQVNDPWGWGRSLEWATSCPPPRHNFEKLPRVRSNSPALDLARPELVNDDHQADPGELLGRNDYNEVEGAHK